MAPLIIFFGVFFPFLPHNFSCIVKIEKAFNIKMQQEYNNFEIHEIVIKKKNE